MLFNIFPMISTLFGFHLLLQATGTFTWSYFQSCVCFGMPLTMFLFRPKHLIKIQFKANLYDLKFGNLLLEIIFVPNVL